MAIDLRHFRCFVAVAEELHFHRAAKKLGVAQPALSRTIKNLEAELGVTLFERSNRRVALSDAGRTFLGGCREVLGKTRKIIEDTQRVQQGKIGTLRIGYTDNAMNGLAPELLKGFQESRPDIALILTHSVTSEQARNLEDEAIDFGFATGSITRSGFDHLRIQSERFVCVVYEGHPFAKRRAVRLQDLAEEPIVQGARASWAHFHSHLAPLFRRAGFEPNVVQEGLTTADIQRLVACGIGIAVLTETVAETLAPGLRMVPLADVTDKLDTIVVWKRRHSTGLGDQFVSFLQGRLGAAA